VWRFQSVYAENARLNGSIGQIDVEFVEREATLRFLMQLSIQFHLSIISFLNTVSILDVFGVERAHQTIHN
jgi:putative transposase